MPCLHRARRSSLNRCRVSGGRRQVQRQIVGCGARPRRATSARRRGRAAISSEMNGIVRDDVACRTPGRAARPPGRCGRARRRRASCRAARCPGTASFPTGRLSSPRRRPARIAPAPASTRTACSATLMLLAPGAFTTRMPRALAAATSTLSTPVPARAMMRRCGAASSSARVDLRGAADDQARRRRPDRRRVRRACVRSAHRRSIRVQRAEGRVRRTGDRRQRQSSYDDVPTV